MPSTEPMVPKRPSIYHYCVCRGLKSWFSLDMPAQSRKSPWDHHFTMFKPLMILAMDDVRRAGFPLAIDIEFKNPFINPGMEFVTSRVIESTVRYCVEAGWIAKPDINFPIYNLTPAGQDVFRQMAHIVGAYEDMRLRGVRIMVKRARTSSSSESASEHSRLDEVIGATMDRFGNERMVDLRPILITRAMALAADPVYQPFVILDDYYLNASTGKPVHVPSLASWRSR